MFNFFLHRVLGVLGGISSSVLSVFFTDKFALSQSDARISVAYNSCQWKTLTKRLMKCPPVFNIAVNSLFTNVSLWKHVDLDFLCSLFLIRPIYIGKNQNPKTWVFCCTVYTARITHNIRGFWHEKRMREKTRISYLCFGKWCACATSLYLWPYTCSAHYVTGRGRVIPLKVTYHVTKNLNNTGEIGASVYIGKKPVKFRRNFKKITLRRWVFRFEIFWSV